RAAKSAMAWTADYGVSQRVCVSALSGKCDCDRCFFVGGYRLAFRSRMIASSVHARFDAVLNTGRQVREEVVGRLVLDEVHCRQIVLPGIISDALHVGH